MAIAYYVPPEYGPPQQQQGNQQQQQAAPENGGPPIVDLLDHHFYQDANNNNTMRRNEPQNNQQRNNQLVSLFTGFVTELLTVFGNRENTRNENQSERAPQEPLRRRRQAAQNLPNINIQQEQEQDNQQPQNPLPDLIPSPFRSLPDIVSCHASAGVSFSYNSTSSPSSSQPHQVNQDDDETTSNRERPPVAPLSPASSQHHPPSQVVDFEFSVKLEMRVGQDNEQLQEHQLDDDPVPALSQEEVYRQEGRLLRVIADSFERSRNSRRHRSSSTRSTFELKIVFSVAVPTVTLVALGIAYLRSS